MTLKDFFTSTELKDGLTTPTRVNDLLTVMQNEKENGVKNVNELTQQWSAVANAIAITENKECLDLFIQLDGLYFINKWLNDAQKFEYDNGNDNQNGSLEELIIALLRAIERLKVDRHKSVESGIGLTVQGLFGHFSSVVREKAKEICDKWIPTDVDSVAISPCRNDVKQSDPVQQETDNDEIPTREIIMESETEIIKAESEKSKSENVALEDEKEGAKTEVEMTNLPSSTDVDNGVDSVTKIEVRKDTSDKDEDMADGGGSSGGVSLESPGAENPKTTSNTGSDEGIEDAKKIDDSRSMKSQDRDLISKRASDMDLDYGMVDPLELARQVAIEVEREVDSCERSCSSSTNEKEPESTCQPDVSIDQIPDTGQELEPNPEKGFSGFDLNLEVSSEENETDCQMDLVSNPISIVSASRAAAADGPPVAPLQFEGALGWKGSAATSAFRKIPEGEKTFSSSSSQNNLKHLDFDLNVAEEPCVEASPRRLERLELDLNSLGEGDSGIINLDWKRDNRVASLRLNGPQSPSISSSSSSMQPSSRNIDLNLNDHSIIPNNASVISIFGTQVEVKRKDPVLPSNGRILEPSMDFSLGRPGSGSGSTMSYANLPAYGHNGFPMGPAMYGPIPYMVDSRGAPIVSIPPTFSQPTQPFFFNMAAPSGSNGAGPSRNNFDLNSGFMTETGTREINNNNGGFGLRQFLNHGQASSSSVIGGKREEPDSGWDPFPINYKHQPPPWQ